MITVSAAGGKTMRISFCRDSEKKTLVIKAIDFHHFASVRWAEDLAILVVYLHPWAHWLKSLEVVHDVVVCNLERKKYTEEQI